MIYSYSPNIAQSDGLLDDEDFTTDYLDNEDRDFLEDVIADYNDMFHTSYDTSADKFQNYYKDLSMRLKNREIDMVIVVNMFLTGFDATTLNTLFVDKDLRMHGLIQAFSRTNRILNSIKTYGNIVSFRNLEQQTNEALELYGNKDVQGTVVLKPYRYYYDQYQAKVKQLRESYPIGRQITGEKAQRHFIMLFGNILRLKNILDSFDEFSGHEILSAIQYQDYQSMYLDMYADYRNSKRADKESINDDLNFEIELVKQVEINVDYILMLVDKYHKAHGNGADEELRTTITKAVNASPTLRDKRDLIERFVDTVSITGTVEEQWQRFISKQQQKELTSIINEEHLKPESTERFMRQAFENGDLQTGGTAITQIMPPISRFTPTGGYQEQKQRVIDKLVSFFDRFVDLGQN